MPTLKVYKIRHINWICIYICIHCKDTKIGTTSTAALRSIGRVTVFLSPNNEPVAEPSHLNVTKHQQYANETRSKICGQVSSWY